MKIELSGNVRRIGRSGLGLIELLISLAISATLLAAVAAAYTATAAGIDNNDQFFRASQAARITVNQILAEVRKCQSGIVDERSLEIVDSQGRKRIYEFNPEKGLLSMRFPDDPTVVEHTLSRNLQSAQFYTDGTSISMMVTVRVGRNSVALSGSAVPRRVMQFK